MSAAISSFLRYTKEVDDAHIANAKDNPEAAQRVVNQRWTMAPGEYPVIGADLKYSKEVAEALAESLGSAYKGLTTDELAANVDIAITAGPPPLGGEEERRSEQEGLSALTVSLTCLHGAEGKTTELRIALIGRIQETLGRSHRRIDAAHKRPHPAAIGWFSQVRSRAGAWLHCGPSPMRSSSLWHADARARRCPSSSHARARPCTRPSPQCDSWRRRR